MFLQMSITASILILLTAIIRFFFREKLPSLTFPVLWAVALVRLLVPVSFYTDYSLQGFIDTGREIPVMEIVPEVIVLDYGSFISEYYQNMAISNPTINWSTVLLILWAVGTLITVVFFIVSYCRFRKQLRFAIPIEGNDLIDNWKEQNRMMRRVTILVCDQITTPFTTGILRPKIYLPKQMNYSNMIQMEYILAHEFYHIKRFDALWKLIAIIALCIHWFNPLVWGMCVLANRDLEITCDAWVVKKYGLDSKKSYAFTLIGMAEKKRQFKTNRVMALSSGFSRNAVEERIKSIMKVGRVSLVGALVAIVMVTVFMLVAFTAPAEEVVAYLYDDVDQTYEYENDLEFDEFVSEYEVASEIVEFVDVESTEYVPEISDVYEAEPEITELFTDPELFVSHDPERGITVVYPVERGLIENFYTAFAVGVGVIMEVEFQDGNVIAINTDPSQGDSTGIQALLDWRGYWENATILSTTGIPGSRFYDIYFSEMWEVETMEGVRYIITSWRSTNPDYPHAYEIRIFAS